MILSYFRQIHIIIYLHKCFSNIVPCVSDFTVVPCTQIHIKMHIFYVYPIRTTSTDHHNMFHATNLTTNLIRDLCKLQIPYYVLTSHPHMPVNSSKDPNILFNNMYLNILMYETETMCLIRTNNW
jgi:hypothetical protein